ncbi:MAG: hypothetical protein IT318_26695 [Anaerolineales bacterium]|nr:hypothetical protein [Anaerolineales bacterium]
MRSVVGPLDSGRLALVPLLLAGAALACGGGVEPTATPLPRPTQRPVATSTPAATADNPDPTARPSATPGSQNTAFTLSAQPYEHPSGAFSVRLPEGWENDEKDSSIFVTSPDDVVAIEISFINVGQEFTEDVLFAFIQSVEDNWFATFPNYEPGDIEPQTDGSYGIYKTLELASGTPQTVFSYYWQLGTVIYEQDFWVDSDAYDQYVDGLLEVANSMTTDPEAGAEADVYAIVYTFTGPNDYFEFNVPFGWAHQQDSTDTTIVDTFTSPTGETFIENLTYDDGQPVDDPGALARQLLIDTYGVDDLEVTDEVPQDDGSVRMDWTSAAQGLEGETFYEARDTAFLLLTWVAPGDLRDLYAPVWSALVDSYGLPEAEEPD